MDQTDLDIEDLGLNQVVAHLWKSQRTDREQHQYGASIATGIDPQTSYQLDSRIRYFVWAPEGYGDIGRDLPATTPKELGSAIAESLKRIYTKNDRELSNSTPITIQLVSPTGPNSCTPPRSVVGSFGAWVNEPLSSREIGDTASTIYKELQPYLSDGTHTF